MNEGEHLDLTGEVIQLLRHIVTAMPQLGLSRLVTNLEVRHAMLINAAANPPPHPPVPPIITAGVNLPQQAVPTPPQPDHSPDNLPPAA